METSLSILSSMMDKHQVTYTQMIGGEFNMGLYESLKDVAKAVQKADNIDLYIKLINLSTQAYELQEEILRLREENSQLKKRREIEAIIIRHQEPVVTKADDSVSVYYCAHCWDNEGRLFQVSCSENGTFICPHCNTAGVYDRKKEEAYDAETMQFPVVF